MDYAKPIVLDIRNNGQAVHMKVGHRLVIRLDCHATSGHGWQLADGGNGALEQVGPCVHE